MNRMPYIRNTILAMRAQTPVVRVECERPRKFARELRKELKMCTVQIEHESKGSRRELRPPRPPMGVIAVRWKDV